MTQMTDPTDPTDPTAHFHKLVDESRRVLEHPTGQAVYSAAQWEMARMMVWLDTCLAERAHLRRQLAAATDADVGGRTAKREKAARLAVEGALARHFARADRAEREVEELLACLREREKADGLAEAAREVARELEECAVEELRACLRAAAEERDAESHRADWLDRELAAARATVAQRALRGPPPVRERRAVGDLVFVSAAAWKGKWPRDWYRGAVARVLPDGRREVLVFADDTRYAVHEKYLMV